MTAQVLRYAAFTVDGQGGNPAGLVLDATGLDATRMQAIAADVDYSETAFLVPRPVESNVYDVRYFSPKGEVPFCGHATIAAAVALAERSSTAELIFHTPAGFVSITTLQNDGGEIVAELTSVAPRVSEPDPNLVRGVLRALRWSAEDLDPDYPVRLANEGSKHLVLVSKNSGGALTVAKLDAAREAGLPVVMIDRPAPPSAVPIVGTVAAVLEWLSARVAP